MISVPPDSEALRKEDVLPYFNSKNSTITHINNYIENGKNIKIGKNKSNSLETQHQSVSFRQHQLFDFVPERYNCLLWESDTHKSDRGAVTDLVCPDSL